MPKKKSREQVNAGILQEDMECLEALAKEDVRPLGNVVAWLVHTHPKVVEFNENKGKHGN